VTILLGSQPLSGLTGSRCLDDEKLIQWIAASSPTFKLYIVDARPKANAMANQMKGGGYENTVYYENVVLTWASIPNIHSMYDSWYKMCALLNRKPVDESHWLSNVEATQWLSVSIFFFVENIYVILASSFHLKCIYQNGGSNRAR
jgi:myotubularin-related protein 1/2